MDLIYGPTINVRKLLYLSKSNIISKDLFGIITLFMLNPKTDSFHVMKKNNYIALFKELDLFRFEDTEDEKWYNMKRRTRRSIQKIKRSKRT